MDKRQGSAEGALFTLIFMAGLGIASFAGLCIINTEDNPRKPTTPQKQESYSRQSGYESLESPSNNYSPLFLTH